MTWGYVYRTTDGQLYIQQDQNSRGQVSVGAGVGSVSVGYTPPAATKAELLTDIKQFPPNRTVQPGPMARGDQPASRQLVPVEPRANLDRLLGGQQTLGAGGNSPAGEEA